MVEIFKLAVIAILCVLPPDKYCLQYEILNRHELKKIERLKRYRRPTNMPVYGDKIDVFKKQ